MTDALECFAFNFSLYPCNSHFIWVLHLYYSINENIKFERLTRSLSLYKTKWREGEGRMEDSL